MTCPVCGCEHTELISDYLEASYYLCPDCDAEFKVEDKDNES